MTKDDLTILVEHYQKTFELTYETWKQRNKLFFILLGLISLAALLTFNAPQANSLLVYWIAHFVGAPESEIKNIQSGFPFGIMQSALLLAVFYLTVNLYQNNLIVGQNDVYLRELEHELRHYFKLGPESKFFTRESTYNTGRRRSMALFIGATYVLSLGVLLMVFLGGRFIGDIRAGSTLLAIVDAIISVMTLVYFYLYAKGAIWPEKARWQPSSSRARGAKASKVEPNDG